MTKPLKVENGRVVLSTTTKCDKIEGKFKKCRHSLFIMGKR